jgi:hypothetical protein
MTGCGVMRSRRLPLEIGEVTAEWLSETLAGRYPGIEVTSFDIRDVLHGFATKLLLDIETNDVGTAAGIPNQVCLKTGFEGSHFDVGRTFYASETVAYGEWLGEVPVRIPRCYYAAIDEVNGQSLVLIEDLIARGVTINHTTRPLSPDQAALGLSAFATLHAKWWGTNGPAGLPPSGGLWPTGGTIELVAENLEEHGRAEVLADELCDPERLVRALSAVHPRWNQGPLSLNHGDSHLGNTYFDIDGAFGFFDWQASGMRTWAHDLSYFLGANLTLENRRASERDLLQGYLEELGALGVAAPSFEDAWHDYRCWMIRALVVWIVNRDDYQVQTVNLTNAERAGAAVMDLDSLAAIDALL